MDFNGIDVFNRLTSIFNENGFSIYLVGGAVRDILLEKNPSDLDFSTDAIPSEILKFLTPTIDRFAQYGVIRYKENDLYYDIVTFRTEKSYKDSRHPNKIHFIKSIKMDSNRRDFTINALYMNNKMEIYDFHNGKQDLKNRVIRTIGNPKKRVKEDPLRILRAIRFSVELNFEIENKLKTIIKKYSFLLTKLSKDKIREEIFKNKDTDIDIIKEKFIELNVFNYIKDMIK